MELLEDYHLKPNKTLYDEYANSEVTKKLNTLPSLEYLNSKFDEDDQMSEDSYDLLRKKFNLRPPFVFYFNPDLQLQEKVIDNGLLIGFYDEFERLTGAGMYVNNNGTIYQGYFIPHNIRHIYGRLIYPPDGNIYEGGFDMSKLHGKGEIEYNDGRVWVGQFANNSKQGEFELYFNNKRLTHRVFLQDDNAIKIEEVKEEIFYERKGKNLWGVQDQTVDVSRESSC